MIVMLHAFSCFFMTGVVWLVQVLVYPNFRLVPAETFASFHRFHTRRVTLVVGPAMILELATAVLLLYQEQNAFFWANFLSVFAIWILTAAVSVPMHGRLEKNPGGRKDWLIWGNWPRTLLWTARSAAWIFLLSVR